MMSHLPSASASDANSSSHVVDGRPAGSSASLLQNSRKANPECCELFCDGFGNIIRIDTRCSDVLGISNAELLNMSFFHVMDEPSRLALYEHFGEAIFKTGFVNKRTVYFSL